jgi:hypothetical protein
MMDCFIIDQTSAAKIDPCLINKKMLAYFLYLVSLYKYIFKKNHHNRGKKIFEKSITKKIILFFYIRSSNDNEQKSFFLNCCTPLAFS